MTVPVSFKVVWFNVTRGEAPRVTAEVRFPLGLQVTIVCSLFRECPTAGGKGGAAVLSSSEGIMGSNLIPTRGTGEVLDKAVGLVLPETSVMEQWVGDTDVCRVALPMKHDVSWSASLPDRVYRCRIGMCPEAWKVDEFLGFFDAF